MHNNIYLQKIAIKTLKYKIKIFFFSLLLPYFCLSQAKECGELDCSAYNLFFQLNSSNLNPNYRTNSQTLKFLHEFLIGVKAKDIDSIKVYSNASPDGKQSFNTKLSQERALSIKNYFEIKYSHIPQVKLIWQSNGENWNLLRELIKQDTNIPSNQSVLNIIYREKNLDQRERQLKQLSKGNPYKSLLKNIFPHLRNSTTTIIYYKKKINANQPLIQEDTVSIQQQEYKIADTIKLSTTSDTILIKQEDKSLELPIIPEPIAPRKGFQIGIKTNLLYNLVLAPNIEIEIPIKRFSINAEYQFPWYVNKHTHFTYEILLGSIEGRYWIKKEERKLSGYFIGAYIGRGIFDLQFSEEGTQGDIFLSTGISGGYSKQVSKHFNMEFSLSLGYFKSNNINYYAYEDLLIKKSTSSLTYFGPTKAKVSLVWIIGNKHIK